MKTFKFPPLWWIVIFILSLFVSILGFKVDSRAAENTDVESQTDFEQTERINALEKKLDELGYTINEIEGTLEAVQTSELAEQEERLLISDKLDLVIIALNDLVNYDIELLSKSDNSELLTKEYRLQVLNSLSANSDSMKQLNTTALQLSDDTVSGNSLVSKLDNTISTGNQHNSELTENYGVYLLIFIGILTGCILGSIFSGYFKHD